MDPANRRLELQAKLRTLAPKAWYQKPPAHQMTYPCFVYKAIEPKVNHADNIGYLLFQAYEILYITEEENDEIIKMMVDTFPHCHVGRKYVADNLYHYVFTIYY